MSGQDQVLDWTSSEAVLTMRNHAVPRGIGHVISIWLITMIAIGTLLWAKRRKPLKL